MPAQSAALEAQGALLNSLHAMASALPTAFGFELCCVAVLRCHMDGRVELSPWGSRFLWGLSLALTAPTNLGRVSLSATWQVLPRCSTPAPQNVSRHHPAILVATRLPPPARGVKVDWAYAPGQVKGRFSPQVMAQTSKKLNAGSPAHAWKLHMRISPLPSSRSKSRSPVLGGRSPQAEVV